MVGLVADVTEDNDLWEEKFLKVVDKASSSQLKYYAMIYDLSTAVSYLFCDVVWFAFLESI